MSYDLGRCCSRRVRQRHEAELTMSTLPGAYALILHATGGQLITVGRLGDMLVVPGYYVYVGSALGPGGLDGRLRRHVAGTGKLHWHIDYLRRVTDVVEAWCSIGPERYEHVWASVLAQMAGAGVPIPGFGASDCICAAHLFYFAGAPVLTAFQRNLAVRTPGVQCAHWSSLAPPGIAHET
jgi:Uri superfamily endonuclease